MYNFLLVMGPVNLQWSTLQPSEVRMAGLMEGLNWPNLDVTTFRDSSCI